MERQLTDRIEIFDAIIVGECNCGEPVVKVLGSNCTMWTNGDRYHYPNDLSAACIYRCRKCCEPIDETFRELVTE